MGQRKGVVSGSDLDSGLILPASTDFALESDLAELELQVGVIEGHDVGVLLAEGAVAAGGRLLSALALPQMQPALHSPLKLMMHAASDSRHTFSIRHTDIHAASDIQTYMQHQKSDIQTCMQHQTYTARCGPKHFHYAGVDNFLCLCLAQHLLN